MSKHDGATTPALRSAAPSILSIVLALAICFVALAVARGLGPAALGFAQMLWGGAGDLPRFLEGAPLTTLTRPWGESASKAALLMLTGLSVAVAFKVGLFNIGAQGQLLVGAITAAALGAQVALPPGVHPAVCLLGAALVGACYALIPAWLKLVRGVHEVISTIMLNWVATSLIENWLVVGPLKATAAPGLSISGTDEILDTAKLPRLLDDGSRLHLGFFIALGLGLLTWLWLRNTRPGFEWRTVGLLPEAARNAGVPVARRTYEAMATSGALAGLAGALLVMGTEFRFPATIGAPYGFDGIAIALLGRNHPLGVLASALLFGVLRAGGTRLQLPPLSVHKSFPELIQGLALLLVAGRAIFERLTSRRWKAAAEEAPRA